MDVLKPGVIFLLNMVTPIHTTKKLEKLIKRIVRLEKHEDLGSLGKWNATVFYVNRKKYMLITNALTLYNVILPNITAKDFLSLDELFKQELHFQLIYDGIEIEASKINAIIGEVEFLPTDNDRKVTGHQNQRLLELDYWKYQYRKLLALPWRELTNRMNQGPVKMEKKKLLLWYKRNGAKTP